MKSKFLSARYAVIQLFFWVIYGCLFGFASLYLTEHGLESTWIGILSASACAVGVILQPILAGYADAPTAPSVKRISTGMAALLLLAAVAMLAFEGAGNGYVIAAYAVAVVITSVMLPFIISIATESEHNGAPVNYSLARGIGSAGYAVLSFTLGNAVARWGIGVHPVVVIISSVGLLTALMLFPFTKHPRSETKDAEKPNPIRFFRSYRRFTVTLVACVLLYIGHVFLNTYGYQVIVAKGGDSGHLGTAMAIAGLAELPVMFLYVLLRKKADSGFWFRVTGVAFFMKALLSVLAPNVYTFYGVQLLQMFGWGLFCVASVGYTDETMRASDRIQGQAYLAMAGTIGNIGGSMLGGVLIDSCGVQGMTVFGTIVSAIGMVLLFITVKSKTKEMEQV